jgi:hypothetical protein
MGGLLMSDEPARMLKEDIVVCFKTVPRLSTGRTRKSTKILKWNIRAIVEIGSRRCLNQLPGCVWQDVGARSIEAHFIHDLFFHLYLSSFPYLISFSFFFDSFISLLVFALIYS